MADLKALFAKKETNVPAPPPPAPDSNESQQVSRADTAAETTTPQPANPFGRRSSSGQNDSSGQPAGGTTASGDDAGGGGQPKSGLSGLRLGSSTRDSDSNTGGVDGAPIDSLESLDTTEDAGVAPRESVTYFADQTPADKPTRELPEGMTAEQLGFIGMLDSVFEILHDPELLGGVIRNIMVELGSNPEYTKLMAPEDVRAMVRGMRESMGLARVKKTEAKAKKSGGKRGSKALDADMLSDLDSLGLNA